jgi:hypothetical protein
MSADADFQFITATTLGQKPESPLLKALDKSGIIDVGGITSLTDRVIDRLKYLDDSSGTPTLEELGHGYQQLIRCFNAFVLMKNDTGNPIHSDWQNLTIKAEFQEFRIIGFASYVGTAPSTTTMPSTGHPSGSPRPSPEPETVSLNSKRGSNAIQHLSLF